MTDRPEWRALVLTETGAREQRLDLRDGSAAELRLTALPGATAIQLPLFHGDGRVLCAEIQCEPEETVVVEVSLDPAAEPVVRVPQRVVYRLPGEHPYEYLPLMSPKSGSPALDVAFVIDGTALVYEDGQHVRLLDSASWERHVAALAAFFERLARSFETVRVTALAFGDERTEGLDAVDLLPTYRLRPERPRFGGVDVKQARKSAAGLFTAMRPSPGGDFVDALAEALEAVDRLPWGHDAMRVVVVSGESPGASMMAPLPPAASGRYRFADVDAVLAQLHRKGIAIVSIYHPLPDDSGLLDRPEAEMYRTAREQYARLASCPALWCSDATTFEPEAMAEAVLRLAGPIARGPALGRLRSPKPA